MGKEMRQRWKRYIFGINCQLVPERHETYACLEMQKFELFAAAEMSVEMIERGELIYA